MTSPLYQLKSKKSEVAFDANHGHFNHIGEVNVNSFCHEENSLSISHQQTGELAQLVRIRRVRHLPNKPIYQYTAEEISQISPADFKLFSPSDIRNIQPEAAAGITLAQFQKIYSECYDEFTPEQIPYLKSEIFSQISPNILNRLFGGVPASEKARNRLNAVTKEQVRNIPDKNFSKLSVSHFGRNIMAALNMQQLLSSLSAFPVDRLTAEQVSWLNPTIFSEMSEKEFLYLIEFFSDFFSGITKEQLSQIPARYFRHIGLREINLLLPEVLSELRADQFLQIQLLNRKGSTAFSTAHFPPEKISYLNPEIFSKMSEKVFLAFFFEQYLNDPNAIKDLVIERLTNYDIEMGRFRIQKITKEQINKLPPEFFNFGKSKFLLSALKVEQLRWLSPEQIAYIQSTVFEDHALVVRFLTAWSEEQQLHAITYNQLRRIPPAALQQVEAAYQAQGRDPLFLQCTKNQVKSLTSLQLQVYDTSTLMWLYAYSDYSSFTEYEVQQITLSDLRTIPPIYLKKLGLDFLRKLTQTQFWHLTLEQSNKFAPEDILEISNQMEGRQQPLTFRHAAFLELPPEEISKLGNAFPLNLTPDEVHSLKDAQLGAMTIQQVRQQGPSFFAALRPRQFLAFSEEQRLAIDPSIFARLDNAFWGFLLPRSLQLQQQHQLLVGQRVQLMNESNALELQRLNITREQRIQRIQQLESLAGNLQLAQSVVLGFLKMERDVHRMMLQQIPTSEEFLEYWRTFRVSNLFRLPHIQFLQALPPQQQQQQILQWTLLQQQEYRAWRLMDELVNSKVISKFPYGLLGEEEYLDIVRSFSIQQVKNIPMRAYRLLGEKFLWNLNPEVLSAVPAEAFLGVTKEFIRNFPANRFQRLSADQIFNIISEPSIYSSITTEYVSQIPPDCFERMTKDMLKDLAFAKVTDLYYPQIKNFYFRLNSKQVSKIPISYFCELHKRGVLPPNFFVDVTASQLNALVSPYYHANYFNERYGYRKVPLMKEEIQQISLETITGLKAKFWDDLLAEQMVWFSVKQLRKIPREVLVEVSPMTQGRLLRRKVITQTDIETWSVPSSPAAEPYSESPPTKQLRRETSRIALIIEKNWSRHADSQQALENYLIKHPTMEAYKMIYDGNGQWRQQKYKIETRTWISQESSLYLRLEKVELIAHGSKNQIEGIKTKELIGGLKSFFSNVQTIHRLNVNACDVTEVFGVELYQAFSARGAQAFAGNTEILSISGSNYPVYMSGESGEGTSTQESNLPAGHHLYEVNGELQHGVLNGRWLIEADHEQPDLWKIRQYKTAKNSALSRIVAYAPEHAGPFEYAADRQKIEDAKGKIEEANQVLQKISAKVKGRMGGVTQQENCVVALDHAREGEGGKYLVPVINIQTGTQQSIEISVEEAQELRAAQGTLKPFYEGLKPYFRKGSNGSLEPIPESAAESPGTLNVALFIKALMEYCQAKQIGKKLTLEEKLSLYVNLGGMGIAVGGDMVALGQLVKLAMAPEGAVKSSLQNIGKIVRGTGMIVTLINLGRDAYTLWRPNTNSIQRTGAAVDLGFNLMVLGLQVAPRVATFLLPEAAEGAAVLGPLAIPVMGAGIGFSALGMQIAVNNEKAHQFYHTLSTYYQASEEGGYTNQEGTLIPKANLPISEINYRTGEITLGAIRIPESEPPHGGWTQWIFGAIPHFNLDQERNPVYFNILDDKKQKLDIQPLAIVLSVAPPVDLDYTYEDSATSKSPEEKNIDQKIQARGKFEPSNSWGNLKPVIKASNIQYQASTQRILLNENDRILILPPKDTSPEFLTKVTFFIEGAGGKYQIRNLYQNTQLILSDKENTMGSYQLEVPDYELLEREAVRVQANQRLLIKDNQINIDISGLKKGSLITLIGKNGKVTRSLVIGSQEPAKITTLDPKGIPNAENYLTQNRGELADFVFLKQEPLQTLWDSKNNRIIAPSENYPKMNADSSELASWAAIKLVGVTSKHGFFVDTQKQTLFQTDLLTNKKIATYALTFSSLPQDSLQIFSEGEQIFLTQTVPTPQGKITLFHELKEDRIELIGVNNLDEEHFQRFSQPANNFVRNLRQIKAEGDSASLEDNLLAEFANQLQVNNGYDVDISTRRATLSPWIRIQGSNPQGSPQTLLFNISNAYSFFLNSGEENSNIEAYGWYPSTTGGGWLVLWNPDTQKSQFVKLPPNDFAPAMVSSDQQSHKITKSINPPPRYHSLGDGKEVTLFKNPEGSVTLVSQDGKSMFFVDPDGSETKAFYQVQSYLDTEDVVENGITQEVETNYLTEGLRSSSAYQRPALTA